MHGTPFESVFANGHLFKSIIGSLSPNDLRQLKNTSKTLRDSLYALVDNDAVFQDKFGLFCDFCRKMRVRTGQNITAEDIDIATKEIKLAIDSDLEWRRKNHAEAVTNTYRLDVEYWQDKLNQLNVEVNRIINHDPAFHDVRHLVKNFANDVRSTPNRPGRLWVSHYPVAGVGLACMKLLLLTCWCFFFICGCPLGLASLILGPLVLANPNDWFSGSEFYFFLFLGVALLLCLPSCIICGLWIKIAGADDDDDDTPSCCSLIAEGASTICHSARKSFPTALGSRDYTTLNARRYLLPEHHRVYQNICSTLRDNGIPIRELNDRHINIDRLLDLLNEKVRELSRVSSRASNASLLNEATELAQLIAIFIATVNSPPNPHPGIIGYPEQPGLHNPGQPSLEYLRRRYEEFAARILAFWRAKGMGDVVLDIGP
jgi:hypothetical protein